MVRVGLLFPGTLEPENEMIGILFKKKEIKKTSSVCMLIYLGEE